MEYRYLGRTGLKVHVSDDATPIEETHMEPLTAVSERPVPYPFGLLTRFQRR